jgi:hypothetical protein
MVSSGMLRRVALVRTDVSEEPGASFIRVTRIGELGTTLDATSNRRTLRRNTNLLIYVFLDILISKGSRPWASNLLPKRPFTDQTVGSHLPNQLGSYIFLQLLVFYVILCT